SGDRERCVRSTIILDGVPIMLETGVQVVRPIAIDYDGQGLFPGRAEKIVVQLKSNLDRAVTGTLSLDGHPGISGSGTSTGFTLPARSYTQCEFTLAGNRAGACLTNLRYEADGLHGSRPAAFRVFGS